MLKKSKLVCLLGVALTGFTVASCGDNSGVAANNNPLNIQEITKDNFYSVNYVGEAAQHLFAFLAYSPSSEVANIKKLMQLESEEDFKSFITVVEKVVKTDKANFKNIDKEEAYDGFNSFYYRLFKQTSRALERFQGINWETYFTDVNNLKEPLKQLDTALGVCDQIYKKTAEGEKFLKLIKENNLDNSMSFFKDEITYWKAKCKEISIEYDLYVAPLSEDQRLSMLLDAIAKSLPAETVEQIKQTFQYAPVTKEQYLALPIFK